MMHGGGGTRFSRVSGEVSGAFGDLGTFLPHVLGVISVAGLKPGGIFTLFGIFYFFTGLFYRLPIPVQPMKVASAAIVTGKVTPPEIAGASIMIGATLVVLGLTGVIGVIARSIPRSVVSGIQLGLGAGLAVLGLKMVQHNLLIGCLTLLVMLPVGFNRRLPQAITGVAVGVLAGLVLGGFPPMQHMAPSLQLPHLVFPGWGDIWRGTISIGLPQLALTLTNAVIVTSTLAEHFFPENRRVAPFTLALTQGGANLLSGVLGGIPMCHGAGGLASHHRFGARTGAVGVLLGTSFLAIGLFFADPALAFLKLIPEGTLGALLFYGALDLAIGGWAPASRWDIVVAVVVALLAFFVNPALAVVVGVAFFRFTPGSRPPG
ncbi:putative sulfate/molybdate transporter [Geomonas sp. RF6]|uniref:putative sulfate/molybdate transporter n=1 Tax=Geomonas sp. RF6 TaxID=2897342 RepID=UPI001E4D5D17|nr:putative sulfate/molybdate transporter [Geomonas sp. RF6]UFS70224.1 putative sulfate/molybdate transporter [Geomonas sp. RF6]